MDVRDGICMHRKYIFMRMFGTSPPDNIAFSRVWGSCEAHVLSILAQHWHLDAFRDPVGSDIQKYRVFSSIFGIDLRIYQIFSSFSGSDDDLQGFVGPFYESILEYVSLPKRIQNSASILRRFLFSF